MLLWVLEYDLGETKIYLCPDNKFSQHLKDALKFESEQSALQYLQINTLLFTFKPEPYSFEFAE